MTDLELRNGWIYDGKGGAPFLGTIHIKNGRIRSIAREVKSSSARSIDVEGRWITPGFIDIHGHNDLEVLRSPECSDKICQGVTTQSVGHCGVSAAPLKTKYLAGVDAILEDPPRWNSFDEYLHAVESARPTTHVAAFVGYANLQSVEHGAESSRRTAASVRRKELALRMSLEAGALGLTTGLTYPPQVHASEAELVRLCRLVAQRDLLYATHIRHNTDLVSRGLEEVISIAKQSGVRAHVSHLQFRRGDTLRPHDILQRIEEAQAGGVALTCDQYPYLAGQGPISAFFPGWVFDLHDDERKRRLNSAEGRTQIGDHMRRVIQPFIGWNEIQIPAPEAEGGFQSVEDIAAHRRIAPSDVLVDHLLDQGERAICLLFGKSEEDLSMLAVRPYCAVGSDGMVNAARVHPRTYGTFIRYLKRYAIDSDCLTLGETVHRMTGLPAAILGLHARGTIDVGQSADLLILDPHDLEDRATYQQPTHPPKGVDFVLVDGAVVVDEGERISVRPGKVLRGGGNI